MSTQVEKKPANKKRSNSADLRSGRYLPDGSLNIAGRWKSPGKILFAKIKCKQNQAILK